MESRLGLRSWGAIALAFVLGNLPFQVGPRVAWASSSGSTWASRIDAGASVELSSHAALRAATVSEISVSAPDTVRAAEGDSVYILATAASGSPYSIISIGINGVPPNLTFYTNTPSAISPAATLSGFLGFQTSGIWHLRWAASDQFGARDTAATELIVRGTPPDVYPARVFTLSGNDVIRLSRGKPWCVQVEPFAGYPASYVILSSLALVYGENRIPCIASKTAIDTDRDGNGAIEIRACFDRDELRTLFAGLPRGTSLVPVYVHGTLVNAAELSGYLLVEVVSNTSHLTASISPNPLNPDATLTFSTVSPGPITVSIFDLQGRLVRELWSDSYARAGEHRVRIDGRGDQGGRLASGVYVYRIAAREGVASGRIVVLK